MTLKQTMANIYFNPQQYRIRGEIQFEVECPVLHREKTLIKIMKAVLENASSQTNVLSPHSFLKPGDDGENRR